MFGEPYPTNKLLQSEVRRYYTQRTKQVQERFTERRRLLYVDVERVLLSYCSNPLFVANCLEVAQAPYEDWGERGVPGLETQSKAKQILRKLIAYSNEYNHLLEREQMELASYVSEKKRLIEILRLSVIGQGYSNISSQLASEEVPPQVIAVLRDIRFDKDEAKRFLPSRVEFVFALSAVYTELRINLVHNDRWSNYERLKEILSSGVWRLDETEWSEEIAEHNNKIVERKIITGNILGAYVHPAIASLKPRFISFSLEGSTNERPLSQHGLLLPLNEAKIREVLSTISLPLSEGMRYANNIHTSYAITGIGIDFSLLPYRENDDELYFILSVRDQHAKLFESDQRFDKVRASFTPQVVSSIYEEGNIRVPQRARLVRYETGRLSFGTEEFQDILETMVQLDAVIIVPQDQLTVGEVRTMISLSQQSEQDSWPRLDWESTSTVPIPVNSERLLRRITSPMLGKQPKGEAVVRHSRFYFLVRDTMALLGQPLRSASTHHSLRAIYLRWIDRDISKEPLYNTGCWDRVLIELKDYLEGRREAATTIAFSPDVQEQLQMVLDSEYLNREGLCLARFEEEMLFLAPGKSEVQAFLDALPLSPSFDSMRICLENYLAGKTEIIYSPNESEG